MAHNIDTPGSVNGQFVDGVASTSTPGTRVDAAWLNDVQNNVNLVVTSAGLTLTKGDGTQLNTAINKLISSTEAAYLPLAGGTVTGDLTLSGSGDLNEFRIAAGNYGLIQRNDGVNFYLLTTNSGSPLGTYNALRPLTVNLATGAVTLASTTVSGSLSAGAVTATSLAAGPTTINGSFSATDTSTTSLANFVFSAPSDGNGINLKLIGNGSAAPSKTIRIQNGHFQIINDAYNSASLDLSDAGLLTVASAAASSLTVSGATSVGSLAVSGAATMGAVTAATLAAGPTTITGSFSATDTSTTSYANFQFAAPSDGNGINLKLIGNGSVTPSKTIRVQSGHFQVVNDAYNAVPLDLSDAGLLTVASVVASSLTVSGATSLAGLAVTGALTATAGATITGSSAVNGDLTITAGSDDNQIRMIAPGGAYGVIQHLDGSDYYVLFTNANDQFGSFNGLRPFRLHAADGSVILSNTTVNGTATVTGALGVTGSSSFSGDVTITGTDNNQLRLIGGGYGSIVRNDGINFALTVTAANNPTGPGMTAPFIVNLANGYTTLSGGLSVGGTSTLNGDVTINSSDSNQLRLIGPGAYGAIQHNDGSNFYLLATNANDQNGNFNGLRPLTINLASGTVTVGSNLYVATNVLSSTSTLNLAGATVQIVNANSSALNALNIANGTAANHAVSLGQFSNSFANPGFSVLPGGLIIQWFQVAVPNDTTIRSYYLPLAFPHVGLSVVASYQAAVPPNSGAIGADFANNSQVRLTNTANGGGGGGNNTISILAVGY